MLRSGFREQSPWRGGLALADLIGLVRADTAMLGGLAPDGGIREPDDGGVGQDGGWTPDHAHVTRCLTTPANYQIWVELEPARNLWKVVLLPVAECSKDFFGGGGYYEIDASSFEILSRKQYE